METFINQHDQVYLEILKEQKSVVGFLDSVFGFLYRCTDFYHLHDGDASPSIGFPPGVAENVVKNMYFRYEQQTKLDKQTALLQIKATTDLNVPAANDEVTVESARLIAEPTAAVAEMDSIKIKHPSELFNGDDRGDYHWSQTVQDLDVVVLVPTTILKSKQLKIDIDNTSIKIEIFQDDNWKLLLNKLFPSNIIKQECLWSLVPGEHIHVNLEKKVHSWWNRLFTDDPPINVRKLDTSVNTFDLSEEDHMQLEEFVCSQDERKRVSNVELKNSLERAWNKEGSPFEGQPIDFSNIEF